MVHPVSITADPLVKLGFSPPRSRGVLYFRTYVLRLSFAESASVSFLNLVTSAPSADCSPGASINNPNIRAYSLVTRSDSASYAPSDAL